MSQESGLLDMELILMIFLIIMSLVELVLFVYVVYLIVKNIPKYLKSRKKSLRSYKEEMLFYSENQEVKKITILVSILIYLTVIDLILSLSFFPELGVGSLSAELGLNVFVIELIIAFVTFSMIPAYFVIKIAFKESGLEKVPFSLAAIIPTIFPLFAFINYNFTGNLPFSLFLLFCGVLFNIVALKYRDLNETKVLPQRDIEPRRMLKGMSIYITELESVRAPIPFGVTPHYLKNIFKLLLGQRERFYFVKNSNLHQKVRKKMDPYFQSGLKSSRESFLFFFIFMVLIFLVAASGIVIFDFILNLGFIYSLGMTLVAAMLIIYLALAWKINKIRTLNGEKHENDIKNAVQMSIDHGKKFLEENELKPEEFPIILRHNDYDGLEYEIKGEKDYIGFFKLDPNDFIDDDLNNVHLNDDGEKLKSDEEEQGYLICEECHGYYKLQEDESPEDFAECECGGKLKYHKDIDEIF